MCKIRIAQGKNVNIFPWCSSNIWLSWGNDWWRSVLRIPRINNGDYTISHCVVLVPQRWLMEHDFCCVHITYLISNYFMRSAWLHFNIFLVKIILHKRIGLSPQTSTKLCALILQVDVHTHWSTRKRKTTSLKSSFTNTERLYNLHNTSKNKFRIGKYSFSYF